MEPVRCTISTKPVYRSLVNVGDKIGIGKESIKMFSRVLKKHNMVARMRGKPFKPKMIVTFVNNDIPHLFQFKVKPYNF